MACGPHWRVRLLCYWPLDIELLLTAVGAIDKPASGQQNSRSKHSDEEGEEEKHARSNTQGQGDDDDDDLDWD